MQNLRLLALLLAIVFVLPGWCDSGILLAQDFDFDDFDREFGGDNIPSDQELKAIFAVIIAVVVVAILIGLAIRIVIIMLLSSCLSRIPPEHREMEPGMVWLLLIPCFDIVWNFFVFIKIPKSFQKYFAAQSRTEFGDCGEQIGLWYCICVVACMVPILNYIAGPAALVLLIIFLVKVLGLKGQISE